MGTFFTILKFAWPFLKELIFGNKDVMGVVRSNWLAFILFLSTLFMFFLFLVITEQAWNASTELRVTRQQIKQLTEEAAKRQPLPGSTNTTTTLLQQEIHDKEVLLKECKADLYHAAYTNGMLETELNSLRSAHR